MSSHYLAAGYFEIGKVTFCTFKGGQPFAVAGRLGVVGSTDLVQFVLGGFNRLFEFPSFSQLALPDPGNQRGINQAVFAAVKHSLDQIVNLRAHFIPAYGLPTGA